MKPKVQFDFWGLLFYLWFPVFGACIGAAAGLAFGLYVNSFKEESTEEPRQQPPSLTDPITPEEIENRRPTANP
jgi:hypothetical protein